MSKVRLGHLDVISGFFIIQIIVMHALQMSGLWIDGKPQTYLNEVLFFFMPWFYFKAGFFNRHKSWQETMKNTYSRLLIPFFIFTSISIIATWLFTYSSDRVFIRFVISPFYRLVVSGATIGGLQLWFLMSFIFVKVIYWLLEESKLKWLAFFAPIIGYLLATNNIVFPMTLSTIPMGVFFYLVGEYYYQHKLRIKLYIIPVLFCIYICVVLFHNSYVDMHYNTIKKGSYFLWVLASVSGLIFLEYILRRFEVNIKWFKSIGGQSMNYYLLHWVILYSSSKVVNCIIPELDSWAKFVILLSVCVITMPIINRFLQKRYPFVFGV